MIYKCLNTQIVEIGQYKLVPIRDEDKYNIMQWRNEQIHHLRQNEPLTLQQQEWYFENVVFKLFEEEKPTQILFSYLEDNICIGYGGLVHVNWYNKNAEVSFLMNTEIENEYFDFHWSTYLNLLETVAFEDLSFKKIYTYAFDLRPQLYKILEDKGFLLEARLKEHCLFEKKFIDVLVHSKWNTHLVLRRVTIDDLGLYYEWANETDVRNQSFNTQIIDFESHTKWFHEKIKDNSCLMIVAEIANIPVGQVRFENDTTNKISVIGISIDKNNRGKGISSELLLQASNYFLSIYPEFTINAYIKETNLKSISSFIKAGFQISGRVTYMGCDAVLYTKSIK
jgi:RimJ/RimL family protein N-acetyltransferase